MNKLTSLLLESLIESLKVDETVNHNDMVQVVSELQDMLQRRLG